MISIPQFTPKRGLSSFVRSLFANSEQGAWYDPSDSATLFQDAAGTTPVTAVEQPVSLMLDKSKGGVGTNGAKRVNLLTYTEQFDNAAWVIGGNNNSVTISANATTAPDGTATSDKINETTYTGVHYIEQAITTSAITYVGTAYAKAAERTWFQLAERSGTAQAYFDLQNGVVGSTVGSGVSSSITSVGNGWYRCQITFTSDGGSKGLALVVAKGNNDRSYAGTNGYGVYVWGADLRLASEANTLPTYQKITDTWYNTQAGNHAYTPSTATASRPVLSARVNLLTKTQELNDAAWTRTNLTATDGATDPLGGSTADTLAATSANGTVTQSVTAVAADHIFSVWLRRKTGTGNVDITCHSGGTWVTQSITSSWAKYTVTQTLTAGARTPGIRIVTSGDEVEAWGADLRVANDGVGIPSYQRVNTSTDYDTVGFPMYLKFDGSDDYMLTNSVDFSGTDKMTVWAGVRKLSDAAAGFFAELSTATSSNNGSWHITMPAGNGVASYGYASRGTVRADTSVTTYTSPISNVFTAISEIATDTLKIRINGTQVGSISDDQGSGNYGNYSLYIGRRGGSLSPFNGRIYSMIIRGASSSDAQIAGAESYVNSKTKAY